MRYRVVRRERRASPLVGSQYWNWGWKECGAYPAEHAAKKTVKKIFRLISWLLKMVSHFASASTWYCLQPRIAMNA